MKNRNLKIIVSCFMVGLSLFLYLCATTLGGMYSNIGQSNYSGGWYYHAERSNPGLFGTVRVDSEYKDLKGIDWINQ